MNKLRRFSKARTARASAGAAAVGLVLAILSCSHAAGGDEDPSSLRWSRKQLFKGSYESATVGDLNRNGLLDIVSGPYWFPGPDFIPQAYRANHMSVDYHRTNSEHLYDVDGDGWLDIIGGGWTTQGIYLYRNPGDGAAARGRPWEWHLPWEAHRLSETRGRMEMFALHDFDGDGVPELFSANYATEEPLEIWRFVTGPDGAPALEPFVLGLHGGGHGFAFGDVNGNGLEDVLTEVGWYERPEGDPFAGPWKFHPETALPHPSCPFAVKDLNGSGRLDLIFGRGHDYGLYWREQLEPAADGATRWKEHIIDESWSQAHAIALADLDGDGEEELIAGKCIWAHNGDDPGADEPPGIYYYKWHRSKNSFTRHVISAPGENVALGRQFSVVDLNGNGRLDLVAPSRLGLWVFFNEGY